MGLFGKKKLELTEIAREMAMQILKPISEETLNDLKQLSIDPNNGDHKREILFLGLYALRISAPMALKNNQAKCVALLDYTQQYVRHAYVDILQYSATEYDSILQQRYDEYDSIMTGVLSLSDKLQSIGIHFTRNVGVMDAALMFWATKVMAGWMEANHNFLSGVNSKFELVP
jgi:hypothetical protein